MEKNENNIENKSYETTQDHTQSNIQNNQQNNVPSDRKNKMLPIALAAIALIAVVVALFVSANTVGVKFPSGGEKLVAGKTYTLKWKGGPNPIQIFLVDTALVTQGESVSIADRVYNIPNTGSYEYTIPTAVQDSTYEFEIGDMRSKTFKIQVIPND